MQVKCPGEPDRQDPCLTSGCLQTKFVLVLFAEPAASIFVRTLATMLFGELLRSSRKEFAHTRGILFKDIL